jgi:hypothetical protein
MSQTDFYSWDAHRNYPLETGNCTFDGVAMRKNVIVDAGFVIGMETELAPGTRLELVAIARTGNSVVFYVEGTGVAMVFPVDVSTKFGTTVYSILPVNGAGFLTVGHLDELFDDLGSTRVVSADDQYLFEEGTIQQLNNSTVNAISTASEKDDPGRTGWDQPAPKRWDMAVTDQDLLGAILFKEGYNISIKADKYLNTLEMSAGLDSGEGRACTRPDLPGYPSSPSKSCLEVLQTINGISPDANEGFSISANSGLSVENLPAENKIRIVLKTGPESPFCLVEEE